MGIGRKDSAERILKEAVKLDPVQFLGVCKIAGVKIYEDLENEEENDEGGRAEEDTKNKPRPFKDIWADLCDAVDSMNRMQRRNLGRLVRAATKKEK